MIFIRTNTIKPDLRQLNLTTILHYPVEPTTNEMR